MAPLQRLNDGFRYTNRSAMRDQITILQPSASNSPDGSPLPFAVFMQNVWASCKVWRSPKESDSTDLVQGEVFWLVNTPYIPGVTSQMQIISPTGAQWFIISVSDPDERQVELRFLCREINGGGVTTEITETVNGGTF